MSNPKQGIEREATRGTSVASISGTTAEDEKRKIARQSQMPGCME